VGGCGKTRLAVEVARAVLRRYPDGVWFVELGPVSDPALLANSVAAVLRVHEKPGQSMLAALTARLRTRRMLVLLDNCEHLLNACAYLVDALLRDCPDLHVLATSREALGLTGEHAWRVPSLTVPDPRQLPPLAELLNNPAVQLFAARAAAARPNFVVTEHTAPTVAQICARLDGIPLALELAAARVAALSVDQISARLDRRFQLLTGGSRAAVPRQQTLRATLDWSYELLSRSERRLLSSLAVFAGGWSLEAAEAVCRDHLSDTESVLDLLSRLISKSLVLVEDGPDGTARYRLLETVRQYARERLVVHGAAEALYLRHAQYFLSFLQEMGLKDVSRAGWLGSDVVVLDRLEVDQDNLRAALRWWIDTGDAERGVRQAAALLPIWYFRGSLTEGCAWLADLLAISDTAETTSFRIRLLPMYATLVRRHGDYASALDKFAELLALQRDTGDRRGEAMTLLELGNVHYLYAGYSEARAYLDDSKTTMADLADALFTRLWLFTCGGVALHEGRYLEAREQIAAALGMAGDDAPIFGGYCLMNLGCVAREVGELAEAEQLLRQSLDRAETFGDRTLIVHALEGISAMATARGQHVEAVRLCGAAEALRESRGGARSPAWARMTERWLDVSRTALGELEAAAAWHSGMEMPLSESIAFARALGDPTSPARVVSHESGRDGDPLTPRERDVAALIAGGISNKQIARQLVITERTVASHVEHILDKLGFASRTQIGIWAVGHQLAVRVPTS
jgi:predicted ATPase/DNA-binding NarL/FixJ family response regulator